MTTPENEDAPTTETPAVPAAGEASPVPPAPAQPPAPPAVPPPHAYGPPVGSNPWVAPPRERWINPAKRTSAIIVGVVAALVLLGVGGVVGAALDHHDGHERIVRMVPDGNFRPGPFGGKGPYDNLPAQPGRLLPTPSATTTS